MNICNDMGTATSAFASALSSVPVEAGSANWRDIGLQRFSQVPGKIELPALDHEVLIAHMAGPFLAESKHSLHRVERRWIDRGDLGVNPSGLQVSRIVQGRPDVLTVHLATSKVHAVAQEAFAVESSRIRLVPKLAEPDETAHRLIQLLSAEAQTPYGQSTLMVETLTLALTIHLLRRHSTLSPTAQIDAADLSPWRMRRVVDYMTEHVDQPLSLADLAQIGGLSASRFVRSFRVAMGEPPHRFLIGLRMKKARGLLETSELSMTEIALQCGFSQASHFSKTFHQEMGLSPRAWRLERRA